MWFDEHRAVSLAVRRANGEAMHEARIEMIARTIPKPVLRYLSHRELADWLSRRKLKTSPRTMAKTLNRADEEGALLWRGEQGELGIAQGDPNAD